MEPFSGIPGIVAYVSRSRSRSCASPKSTIKQGLALLASREFRYEETSQQKYLEEATAAQPFSPAFWSIDLVSAKGLNHYG